MAVCKYLKGLKYVIAPEMFNYLNNAINWCYFKANTALDVSNMRNMPLLYYNTVTYDRYIEIN